jgi:hypothetical protein
MSQFFLQKKMLMRFTHQHQKVYTPETTTTEAPTEPANPPEPVDPGEEG